MTNYMPYSYNGEYANEGVIKNDTTSQPASPPLQQGLMSISQPETPRPESTLTSPPNEKQAISPNLIRRRPPIPSRPANFTTTTFHSNPYPSAGPIRRRRTESIFSFEMGPTFSSTKQLHDLCNMDQSNSYQVQLHAKMDRGFFRADQDWTCYRRNYFQVSSTFDVHGMNYLLQNAEVPCLLRKTDTQEFLTVDYFSIGVCARVTNHDKKIELVQHTPKRDKGPQMIPEPRPVRAGGNLHLASVGSNHNIVTFERLQFKTATANNGKRRAAQQYYEIVVDLYANCSRGESIRVATCTSAPLVVRGRSPGHYADSHTRFKHIDDSSISNDSSDHPPQQESSPTNRYNTSLPNSPISDFGPYSPYNSYPYSSISAYSPMMPPQSSNLSPYASHPPPSQGQVPAPYFQTDAVPPPPPSSHLYENNTSAFNDKTLKAEPRHGYWAPPSSTAAAGTTTTDRLSNSQESSSHYHTSLYNMNSTDPYGRENTYSNGLDAGRP
ncbi:hypothetical protein INT47_008634 [Mucor saturninus]|uniref:NDT80 domain-containing protein n=1 Tax=Mucor saturninus TaxID=64648 RepID=A0A8H7UWQ6_9FUNG|nr:hypothetical protein INT47_008634 [Mucor saturninus]